VQYSKVASFLQQTANFSDNTFITLFMLNFLCNLLPVSSQLLKKNPNKQLEIHKVKSHLGGGKYKPNHLHLA